MGHLWMCPICEGQGTVVFESGPAAEPCTSCDGTGQCYSDPELRGLFEAMIEDRGVMLDPAMRLLLNGLAALDARVASLERELRRR